MPKIGLFLVCLLLCLSCDKDRIFDNYKRFENLEWVQGDPVHFQFEIQDSIAPYDLFISLRNTEDYEFSNLFLIAEMQFPNGFHMVDTLEYMMTDSFGNWLGKGYTDIKENKLYYKEQFVFPMKGQYEIHIQQAMRKRNEVSEIVNLKGISEVGFRIESIVK